MILEKRYGHGRQKLFYNIETAIEIECDSDHDGAVERSLSIANNATAKLGQLVALLHTRGVLTSADVLSLLPTFVSVNETP